MKYTLSLLKNDEVPFSIDSLDTNIYEKRKDFSVAFPDYYHLTGTTASLTISSTYSLYQS